MDIVIFGVGETYKNKKTFFQNNMEKINIVAFLDNNSEFQGKELDGVTIYAPKEINNLNYDGIVILSEKYMEEMTAELLEIGVKKNLIWNFTTLKLSALKGKKTMYGTSKIVTQPSKGKILIVTTEMGFNGGTMVAVYAAKALQDKGYEVMLSAPAIHKKLLQEILDEGLNITVWDCLPYLYEEDESYINDYDAVIVNVFQMMNCAYKISKVRPVLWWIHENRSIGKSFYQNTQKEFYMIDTSEWMSRLEVLGVSNIAQEAFNHFYPSVIKRILPFGIPDRYMEERAKKIQKTKIILAVTAGFSLYKGQAVLIDAIGRLPKQEKDKVEIWFIGPNGQNQKDLEDLCIDKDNVRFLGLLSHEEVIHILPHVDVLVCPSLIETMSMSTIEGMMFGKICIATDMTGVSKYIENGRNGFVVQANESDDLAKCISWIVNNQDKWGTIRIEARKTYEKEFTLAKLGDRLEREINICKEKFHENINDVPSSIS